MKFLKTEEHFNMPICTVLLITYNHAEYIRKAIDSVLEQKTQYDFVIHIFDDASNDGTSDIIREYAQNYPDKIRPFISETNKGAQNNIWNAYKSVKTKYCALLECDDYWCDENKLELQIAALEQHPECASCAGNTIMFNKGDKYDKAKNGSLLVSKDLIDKSPIFTRERLKGKFCGYINHISTRIINMEKVNLDEIRDLESFCYDNAQFFYLLSKGPIIMIDKIFSVRIMTGSGIFSSLNTNKKLRIHLNALIEVNRQIDYQLEEIIYEHLQSYLSYFTGAQKQIGAQRIQIIENIRQLNNIKKLKHYILSDFLIDILDLPRDIFRIMKNRKEH